MATNDPLEPGVCIECIILTCDKKSRLDWSNYDNNSNSNSCHLVFSVGRAFRQSGLFAACKLQRLRLLSFVSIFANSTEEGMTVDTNSFLLTYLTRRSSKK